MEEKKTILDVKHLRVDFTTDQGTVQAVRDVSFSVKEGEILGIVGESGSGKSVTMYSVMGLLAQNGSINEGEIVFNGESIARKDFPDNRSYEKKMREIRGNTMAMIFQDPMTALNPVLTVGSQVRESLEIHNYDNKSHEELDARVDELFNLVGIPADRKKEYPHQFSGGMKQRIVIAIALACQPQLLIADEPTTALDVTIQAQVLMLMEELKKKLGTSMIMITHDLGVVAETCDKVAVMYAGEIVEYGSLKDIFSGEKHHPYTVGLFQAIPNLDVKTDRLQPIDGLMPDPAALPPGCKFSPRCPHCTEQCRSGIPLLYENEGHRIFCNLYAEGE